MHSAARPPCWWAAAGCARRAAGWLAQGLSHRAVLVVEPDAGRREALGRAHGVRVVAAIGELLGTTVPGTLVLAVKPQTMAAALEACAGRRRRTRWSCRSRSARRSRGSARARR